MAVSPFITLANAIITANTHSFLPEYVATPANQGGNSVQYKAGVYYSSLAPSNAPGEYLYHQEWSSNPGYENVGIMMRSNDGQYQNSINGGSGNDAILGNAGFDGIVGGEGSDLIMGAGGDDSLTGLTGDDTIVAGYKMAADGQDFLTAWRGLFSDPNMTEAEVASQFILKEGDAKLYGGDGNDLLVSSVGDDELHGGVGNDTIFGGSGDDTIYGETGDGAFGWTANQTGNDTIYAGFGNDSVSAGSGNDVILGEDGNDTLNGDAGIDQLFGGVGNDTLHGGDGDDTILGDAGMDTLNGDAGNDKISGGDGNDRLNGGDGNDTFNGNAGDDIIQGDAGDDIIQGGAGNDQIHGGAGTDIVQGGAGNDIFVLSAGSEVTRVVGQADDGNDMVFLTSDVSGLNISKAGTNLVLVGSNKVDGVIIEDWFSNHSVEFLGLQSNGNLYNLIDLVNANVPSASTTPQPAMAIASQYEAAFAESLTQVDFSAVQSMDVELVGISPLSADAHIVV
ncbi:MAG: calcium-binding protein [Desulfobacteraceae bacterium]|nr:calcium-binding protein [Desulfobacteraceae bacterium]